MRMKMKWTPSLFPKDDSGIRIRLFVYLCFRKDHCALDHHESAVRSWERTGLWLMGRDKLAQLKFWTASPSETIPVSFQMHLSIQMEDRTWHPRSWPWCSAGWASRCLSLSCVLRPAWGQKSAGIPEQSAWPAAAPHPAATSPAEAVRQRVAMAKRRGTPGRAADSQFTPSQKQNHKRLCFICRINCLEDVYSLPHLCINVFQDSWQAQRTGTYSFGGEKGWSTKRSSQGLTSMVYP